MCNIFGDPSMGKTTMLRQNLAGAIRAGQSVTFVDSIGVNEDMVDIARGRSVVSGVVNTPDGWAVLVRRAVRERRPWFVVVVPTVPLEQLWRKVYEIGRHTLAVDEIEGHASSAHTSPALLNIGARGRNKLLNQVHTCRLPPELNKQFRALANVQISFRQSNRDYAEQIAKECLHNQDAAPVLMRLRVGQYLRFSKGKLTRGIVDPAAPL